MSRGHDAYAQLTHAVLSAPTPTPYRGPVSTTTVGTRPSTVLRRAVLVFSLREPGPLADLVVTDAGMLLPGGPRVGWDELAGGCGPEDDGLARRVARWLRLRHHVARLVADGGPDVLLAHVRPLALPTGHAVRPGPRWAAYDVLGGAVEVGLGLRHVDDDGRAAPDAVGVLPLGVLHADGIDPQPLLDSADRYLAEMAELAAERLLRSPSAPLRPLGDCDVVTLLASPTFRLAVVRDAVGVVGLRSAAVPVRRRGWLDLGRVDPAFALAAASLTEPDERGFCRPLLVTADEVVQVREGGSRRGSPSPTRWHRSTPSRSSA